MSTNTLKTFVLLAAFGGLIMGIGALFGEGGLVVGFVVALLVTGGSYWFSDKIAVAAARAKPLSEEEAPWLYATVRELAARAGMPMPRLYLSPEAQPNAFATGRNPRHAVVCVTQGILQVLDRDELAGVLAHELSHVRNRDILIGSVAAALAMVVTFLARMLMWGSLFFGGRDREGGNVLGVLAMAILAPIAALLLQMAISRSREYEADRTGAEILGDGEPLARALEKIDAYARRVPMDVDPAQASAYIVNPLTGRKVNFASLFSTHPPTEERIARLRGRRGA
jgi:heat shock protein HtpX